MTVIARPAHGASDIYLREGCYTCRGQMIRRLRDEVDRWEPYSLAVESKYDHPMLWGSKRTGPDLARVGGKYSDAWHFAHLYYPRDGSPAPVMPAYRWLARRQADLHDLPERLATLRSVGVPYRCADRERGAGRARPRRPGR
jgi:cytochrome c oxidase cbb3-type subunit II